MSIFKYQGSGLYGVDIFLFMTRCTIQKLKLTALLYRQLDALHGLWICILIIGGLLEINMKRTTPLIDNLLEFRGEPLQKERQQRPNFVSMQKGRFCKGIH